MMNKVRKNVVLELSASSGGLVHFRLHLGNRAALPPDFMRRYCAESPGEKLLRLLGRWAGEGTRHHFRMKVEPYDASLHGLFAWRVEDTFQILREAGFLLLDDSRGEWSPYDIYRHLMEQGRISTPMPVLRESPEGYTEITC
ncbi:MAG: hypothetical protein IJB33_01875 [Akkermansia sp.]|nr:hypothetical protein [Akkermansia sp.]